MFLTLLLILFFTVSVIFTDYPPFPSFRIVQYSEDSNERYLFGRVYDPCCPFYVQQDDEDVVMYYVNHTKWITGKNFTIDNEDSSCPVVTFMKNTTLEVKLDEDFVTCESLDDLTIAHSCSM